MTVARRERHAEKRAQAPPSNSASKAAPAIGKGDGCHSLLPPLLAGEGWGGVALDLEDQELHPSQPPPASRGRSTPWTVLLHVMTGLYTSHQTSLKVAMQLNEVSFPLVWITGRVRRLGGWLPPANRRSNFHRHRQGRGFFKSRWRRLSIAASIQSVLAYKAVDLPATQEPHP